MSDGQAAISSRMMRTASSVRSFNQLARIVIRMRPAHTNMFGTIHANNQMGDTEAGIEREPRFIMSADAPYPERQNDSPPARRGRVKRRLKARMRKIGPNVRYCSMREGMETPNHTPRHSRQAGVLVSVGCPCAAAEETGVEGGSSSRIAWVTACPIRSIFRTTSSRSCTSVPFRLGQDSSRKYRRHPPDRSARYRVGRESPH